jgi:hypothetical protein
MGESSVPELILSAMTSSDTTKRRLGNRWLTFSFLLTFLGFAAGSLLGCSNAPEDQDDKTLTTFSAKDSCEDIAPPKEQAAARTYHTASCESLGGYFHQCDEPWIVEGNFCQRTCARCPDQDPFRSSLARDVNGRGNGLTFYEKLNKKLQELAQSNSRIAEYNTFGSDHGRDMVYLRISKAVEDKSLKLPQVLINGGLHGHERWGMAIAIDAAMRLVTLYGKDSATTELVDSRDIFIVPMACPSAVVTDNRTSEGTDANRAFPYPGDPKVKPIECSSAMQELFARFEFKAAADYHAWANGPGGLLQPWAFSKTQSLPQGYLQPYATLMPKMAEAGGGYPYGVVGELMKYEPAGTLVDFYLMEGQRRQLGTMAITVEASQGKYGDSPIKVMNELDRHDKMLRFFIKEAPLLAPTLSN